MKFLKLLKKSVIDSQIYVSLMGTLLMLFLSKNLTKSQILVVFLTYLNGYLYTKYQHTKRLIFILIFNILSSILILFLLKSSNTSEILKWLIIVILGMLYNSRFLAIWIRKIPLFKVFYVGFVWALMNAWMFTDFNSSIFSISLLFISALVLPFDIRDFKQDDVVTFPKIIGVQNTKFLAYFLVFTSLILAIFNLEIQQALAFFITSVFTFFLIYFSENHNRDWHFSFGVESCLGLPFLFSVLLKYF